MVQLPSRRLPDFIEAYLKFTDNSESPTSYHLWSALSIISGTMERRCFMVWGHTTIYANQYIFLIGPSGRARKGEPITIARTFMEAMGLNLVSESITTEALIRRMKQAESEFVTAPGAFEKQCAMSVAAEELTVFLGEGNMKFLADLTNWYDSRDNWTYETKHSGTDPIRGVCFNLLGSMAPDWIPVTIPHGAIGGGFTSRIIFVVETKKRKIVKNPNTLGVDEKLRAELEHDLELMRQLTGRFEFTTEAETLYENWYLSEEQKIESGRPALKDPRFAGYVSRRGTHIKKLCMAVSASRDNSLRITAKDFARAKGFLEAAEISMEGAFGRVGKAAYTDQVQTVIEMISAKGQMKRSHIMRAMYRDIDEMTMQQIEATLRAMKVVKVRNLTEDDCWYDWIGDPTD